MVHRTLGAPATAVLASIALTKSTPGCVCARFGRPMQVVFFIIQPGVIRRILFRPHPLCYAGGTRRPSVYRCALTSQPKAGIRTRFESREISKWDPGDELEKGIPSAGETCGFLVETDFTRLLQATGFREERVYPFEGVSRRLGRVGCLLRGVTLPARFPLFVSERRE